jgi:hypothetical protein
MTRREGGQPGNKNALKHGIYARHYPEEVKKAFKKWDLGDFAAEIQLLRVAMDKMAEAILAPGADRDAISKEVNAIAHGVDTLVKAATQQMQFNSRDDPVLVAWNDILNEEEFFQDGVPPE